MNDKGARPTMRDVATQAGVSPITVSRVLRDDPRVAGETRARVHEAVRTLGYQRNEAARSLRLGRSGGLFGLVVTNLANPFYSQLALGVEALAAERGMRVILGNSGEDPQREQQLVHDFASRRLAGVIVVPTGGRHAHLDPAALGGLPVVLAASPPANIDVDAVLLDDFGGTFDVTKRLLGRGHTRIGFLGPSVSTWTGSERFRGFCAALEEAGVSVDDSLVSRHQVDVPSAEQAAGAMLDHVDPPTALFCGNNRNTIGAYRAILRRDTSTALAGFDDFELADALLRPVIVVSYDMRELGSTAARLLCERIDGTLGDTPTRRVVMPTSVVEYG